MKFLRNEAEDGGSKWQLSPLKKSFASLKFCSPNDL